MQKIVNTRAQHSTGLAGTATEVADPPTLGVAPRNAQQATALSPQASSASVPLLPSTARRLANIRLLLAELSQREMNMDEIALLLNASASAVRNDIVELRRAGIVHAVHVQQGSYRSGKPSYRLSSNPELSRAFIDGIVNANAEGDGNVVVRRGRADKPGQFTIGNGRRIHMFGDEVHYAVRVDRDPVRRDPLVTALFGAAQAFS
jgi:DNA-binding transcriptional ArsR family regulator